MITPISEIVHDLVPEDVRLTTKWNRGYHADYDLIVISKDGTLGEIHKIAGLNIGLPAAPKKIDGDKLSIEEQKWKRTPIPNELSDIDSDQEFHEFGDVFIERHQKYIHKQYKLRENGYWFMLNGKPMYLTGKNWMFVQWSKLEHLYYPNFRYPQWVLWIHWEACIADKRSCGQCYLKNRRSGYSTMSSCDNVEYATSHRSKLVGIMSKTSGDAETMFMDMVTPVFKYYPFFFKPLVDGSTNPRKELAFREISKRITAKNKTVRKESKGLNTVIRHYPTTLNSMDGKKVGKGSLDEISKFPKDCAFDKYWQIFKQTLYLGKKVFGKTMAGSTANSDDKGGAEFKSIYNDSKVETRDEITEETISGMYSLFIPAEFNMDGFFDIYGFPIIDDSEDGILNEDGEMVKIGSATYLTARRKKLEHSPEKLNEELRMYPSTEEHAFRDAFEDCHFDSNKIYEQLEYNSTKVSLKTNESMLFRRGKLIWTERFKTAKWVNDRKGMMVTTYVPVDIANNKSTDNRGNVIPGNSNYFSGGCDSYDINRTSDGRGSKGSLHIYAKNSFAFAPNQFIFEYVDRPTTSLEFFENCAKIAVYCGCKILIENNKPAIIAQWKNWGLDAYISRRPDRKAWQLTPNERGMGGIPSTPEVINTHAEALESYIDSNVGLMVELGGNREIGMYGNCYFDLLLKDWLKYDMTKRKPYDRTVSSGLALMDANRIALVGGGGNNKKHVYFKPKSKKPNNENKKFEY